MSGKIRLRRVTPEEEHVLSQIADLMETFDIDEETAKRRLVADQVIRNHMAKLAIGSGIPISLISYEVTDFSWKSGAAFPLQQYQYATNTSRSDLRFNQVTMTWESGKVSFRGMDEKGNQAFMTEAVYHLVFASGGNFRYH